MSIAPLTSALVEQLEQIPNLRVFDHVPDTVAPPAALVMFPEAYRNPADMLLHRGNTVTMRRNRIPVRLVLARVSESDVRENFDEFVPQVEAAVTDAGGCNSFVSEIRPAIQRSIGGIDVMTVDVIVEAWAP
jgi:hypothetical protein